MRGWAGLACRCADDSAFPSCARCHGVGGGQVALAAVEPVARRAGGVETTRAVARRFQLAAWPAFAVLVGTGIWNLFAVHEGEQSNSCRTTLAVELVFIAISGARALVHTLVSRRHLALGGIIAGLALLAALGATFLGYSWVLASCDDRGRCPWRGGVG